MAELTAADLEQVLALVTGQDMETPGEVLHVARLEQPSLVATLLSVWEAEGHALGPALTHELAAQRGRMDYYRDLHERLAAEWRDPVSLKGLEIAGRYPKPLVRYMNDLDYWIPDRERYWEVAEWLLADGWSTHSATFFRGGSGGGEPEMILSLRRLPDDPYALPYGVELTTVALLGDGVGVPNLASLPAACADPAVKNLVALLYERFEQPFRARDLVDTALLLDGAPLPDCARAVTALGLWPEYVELAGLLADSPLEAPELPGDRRALARACRRRRRITMAGAARRPFRLAVTALQRGFIGGRAGRAWQAVTNRMSARAALDAGLMLFGLPVAGETTGGLTLRESGGALWAHTPVGPFILVHGDVVGEDLLGGASVVEVR
ncbi:nucleotidyltransferase family protein [Acrocarpospora catenulata]|uniref:nucleotidyltransferase family protein n=1 Tax=Acrocarpospora catenulata TaxID=2836182 RepID=UPI001BD9B46B|nr:nucleotidyltransferase family protein [Acrocarpospora catenulata]